MTQTDAFEMALIHDAFRREVGRCPTLIAAVTRGDTGRSAVVAAHVDNICAVLHHHHTAEDALLWPKLAARVPLCADDVARMQAAHEGISEVLTLVHSGAKRWAATADTESAADLLIALDDLALCVGEHLDDEERLIVPLINTHITPSEWRDLLAEGAKFLSPRNIRFALAFASIVLENASAEEKRRFMAGVPAAPRLLLMIVGRYAFTSYRRRLAA